MKFIKGVPEILVNDSFKIKSVQYFDEDEDRIVLRCAEYVPQFEKGYLCNMVFSFEVTDIECKSLGYSHFDQANDLVLVHIRKSAECNEITQFEYVFYK